MRGVLLRVLVGVLLFAGAGAFGASVSGEGGANLAGLAVTAALIYLVVTCLFLLVRWRRTRGLRRI